ncbi:MAG: GNAT family N-acetyltransferase [Micromonosporaceae bacterium]|jgi:ribosomal protein S18 acetylase RimI-like enzyme
MVTVRPAGPEDAADVVRVQIGTWQTAYAGIMPASVLAHLDEERERRTQVIRERLASGSSPFSTLVAVDDGRVVGFATYGPYRRQEEEGQGLDPTVGEVLAIYVEQAYQGRGAGRALMDRAVADLRDRGLDTVRLWVLEENSPARRFYERYGYVADGARHHFRVTEPDGTPVDLPVVRYTLRLR